MAAPGTLNLDVPPAWGARTIEAFDRLEQIGEGTYGTVFMAREKATNEVVALKKVRMDNEKEGFPITAIREIKILKKLKHENIVNLKEIVTSKAEEANRYKGSIFMVFEYMDHDLAGLADRGIRFSVPQIKCYMRQMLKGLHYCHVNKVLHRDIKGSNILISNQGILKIADFGLARSFSSDQGKLTNKVITLWYRPPELLMGAIQYGPEVDMWSVGCIFAELLTGKAILPGKVEMEQLNLIFQLCGSPDETTWPGCTKLPFFETAKPERAKRRVREAFKNLDRHALDLLDKMLVLNPAKRISAADALNAEYFWTEPLPAEPSSLPKYEPSHEYQTKKRRQQQRQPPDDPSKRQRTAGHPPLYPQPRGAQAPGGSSFQSRGAGGAGGGAAGGYGAHGYAYGSRGGDGADARGGRSGGGGAYGGSGYGGGGGGGGGGYAHREGSSSGRGPAPRGGAGGAPPYAGQDREGRSSHLMPPPPPPGHRSHSRDGRTHQR